MTTLDRLLDVVAQDIATAGGAGSIVALLLLLACRVLLPSTERHRWKKPLRLFLIHVVVGGLAFVVPAAWIAQRFLSLISLFFLLGSIGRSILMLGMYSYLARGFVERAPRIIQDIGHIAIYVVAGLATLRAAGIEPGSLLTTSALLTAVIGLSLQETLGNVFAGLALQAEKPFALGDWIQLEDQERRSGRVSEVNWRATKIISNDNVELIIPNATLAKATIRNHSRPTPSSRRSVEVSAPYSVAPERVRAALLGAIDRTEGILKTPSPVVLNADFAESGVTYVCRFSIDDFARRYDIEASLRDHIWYAFRRAAIEIPFPTRTVYATQITKETEARGAVENRARRRAALERVDFFRAMPAEARDILAETSELSMFGTDEVIVRQGDRSAELYVIESGRVAVLIEEKDRSILEISALGPGDFFGEMSLMTGEPRRATVRATEPTVVVVASKASLEPLMKQHPGLAETISEILAARRELLATTMAARGPAREVSKRESSELLARIRQFFSIGS